MALGESFYRYSAGWIDLSILALDFIYVQHGSEQVIDIKLAMTLDDTRKPWFKTLFGGLTHQPVTMAIRDPAVHERLTVYDGEVVGIKTKLQPEPNDDMVEVRVILGVTYFDAFDINLERAQIEDVSGLSEIIEVQSTVAEPPDNTVIDLTGLEHLA